MIGIDIISIDRIKRMYENFELEDSISVLTQYSNTPNCLIKFLDEHLKVA